MLPADNLCKQFWCRSGQTKHQAWSGSKLFKTLTIFQKCKLWGKSADDRKKHDKLDSMQRVIVWLRLTCDFQKCGILIRVDSDELVQPPFKLRNSKWCLDSSLKVIEYSSDKQRLWSDCAYAQADQRLCLSHIPHCWKSHVAANFMWLVILWYSHGIFVWGSDKTQKSCLLQISTLNFKRF